MSTTLPSPQTAEHRVQQLLARLRRKQLDLAIAGNVSGSARYAQRAWRVRLLGRRPA